MNETIEKLNFLINTLNEKKIKTESDKRRLSDLIIKRDTITFLYMKKLSRGLSDYEYEIYDKTKKDLSLSFKFAS